MILVGGGTIILGIFYAVFGLFNLLWDSGALGSFGAKFIYEMDGIMGDLIGVPRYSKIEAVILLGSSFCLFSVLQGHFWLTACGLIVVTGYMITCTVYAYCVKLPQNQFLGMGMMSCVLLYFMPTRIREGYDPSSAGEYKIVTAFVTTLFVIFSCAAMLVRAPHRSHIHERYQEIIAYCDAKPDFVWINGKDAPEEFEEEKNK